MNDRKFGVEIEGYNVARKDLAKALRTAGIPAIVGSRGRCAETANEWRVVRDGSIVGGNDPFELVSPILSGSDGINQIKKVCEVLESLNAQVNFSCGLHVHIDARNMSAEDVKAVVKRYMLNEDIIDSFMPKSRRGDNNRFCRSIVTASYFHNQTGALEGLEEIGTIREMTQRFCRTRYVKLNIVSYLVHGSIEFRHHGGTTDAKKIVNWVSFLQQFVDGAIAGNIGDTGTPVERFEKLFRAAAASPNRSTSLKDLKDRVMQLLDVTSTAQVKKWALQHGLTLDLRGKASWETIWQAVSHPSPTTTTELNNIKAFYRNRMAELSTNYF